MKSRRVYGAMIMMCVLAFTAYAGGKGELQKYFNNAATRVQATDDPVGKARNP